MAQIIKIVDFIEEKTDELRGEVLSIAKVKHIDVLEYIEKRVSYLTKAEEKDNFKKLSNEREIDFLLKLKKRISND